MDWNEITVNSWNEFTDALEEVLDAYRGHFPPTYIFRGQADSSWLLKPSLLRQLEPLCNRTVARKVEEFLENEFKAQASLFPETEKVWLLFDVVSVSVTELWAYMQHHGCPTRLLDWTASAYVAAYFAVNQFPEKDGAIFVVGAAAIDNYVKKHNPEMAKISDAHLVRCDTPERVVFTWPHLMSHRVVAQQGHFSVNTNVLANHDNFILEACSSIAANNASAIINRKIIIRAELKIVILQQLRAMNIAAHSLFPSLDGLGKSLSDMARLRVRLALADESCK